MSDRTERLAVLRVEIKELGGDKRTIKRRMRAASRFVDVMDNAGVSDLRSIADIRLQHRRRYVVDRLTAGIDVGAVRDDSATLDRLLRDAKRAAATDASDGSSDNASRGRRHPNRDSTPLRDVELELIVRRATSGAHVRPGMAALFLLARYLGLRADEAICARMDTLARWLGEIDRCHAIEIPDSNFVGRPRRVQIADVEKARHAVSFALAVASRQGGVLIVCANGARTPSLKYARELVDLWCDINDASLRGARNAFKEERWMCYLRDGYSKREARVALRRDMGQPKDHGTPRAKPSD